MTQRSKEYVYIWIALGIIIFAATSALIVPSILVLSSITKIIIGLSSWLLIILSSLFLFFRASNTYLNSETDTGSTEKTKTFPSDKKKPDKNKLETLDIQSSVRKIVRKSKFSKDLNKWGKQLLNAMVSELEIMSGIIYFKNEKGIFEAKATYALPHSNEPFEFKTGEGLTGQVALNLTAKIYTEIPKHYSKVFSGLGSTSPSYLAMIPILAEEQCIGVIEVAGFRWNSNQLKQLFDLLSRDLSNHFSSQTEKPNA